VYARKYERSFRKKPENRIIRLDCPYADSTYSTSHVRKYVLSLLLRPKTQHVHRDATMTMNNSDLLARYSIIRAKKSSPVDTFA